MTLKYWRNSINDIAYDIANGKKGAVHIDFRDISSSIFTNTLSWKNEIKLTKLYNESVNKDILNSKVDKSKNSKNDNYMFEIANIINNSKKPILYIGRGCYGHHNSLTYLANTFEIPVTTTIHAMGIYDENNKLSCRC